MNRLLPFAAFAVVIVACTGTSSGAPPETAGASSCSELADAARSQVDAAIHAHQTCATDADCVETSLGASCFDSCARVVSASGVADVGAARSRVDGAQCKTFLERGCKMIVPPCAPPRKPRCDAGACAM